MNARHKYLIFFSFYLYPLAPDFLCISYFSYPLWMFIVFMIMRAVLLDIPIVISALCYWIMLRLRFYAFFHLPHHSIQQVLLPYLTGLILDRFFLFATHYVLYRQIQLPLWWEVVMIFLGSVLVIKNQFFKS